MTALFNILNNKGMKTFLVIFDGSSFYMIPSCDFELEEEGNEIAFQSNNWDACETFCDKENDKLLGVTYSY